MLEDRISRMLQQQSDQQQQQEQEREHQQRSAVQVNWKQAEHVTESRDKNTDWRRQHLLITGGETTICRRYCLEACT